MVMAKHQQIVATKGDAIGKLTGINHLVLIVKDIDESVRFYRDILGLKVVITSPPFDPGRQVEKLGGLPVRPIVPAIGRQYFLELPNGELMAIVAVAGSAEEPDRSIFSPYLWPDPSARPPAHSQKVDHIAFNVETRDDLVWFQRHLREHGTRVSEIEDRVGSVKYPKFVKSIYFYDPSGNALEICTFDWSDASWSSYDREHDWLRDDDPVPSLLE